MFLSDLTGLSSLDAPTVPLKDYLVSCSPSKTILAVIWNPKNVPDKINLIVIDLPIVSECTK